ncbi:MAG: hypothetical protein EP297_02675, partial [Gammaproteobacteria bacterium]
MRKIIEFSARYAWLVIAIVAVITYIAFTQISALVIDVSPEGLMVRDHPDRHYYEKILEDFGTDNVTIVVIKDANLQDRERLLKIRQTVDALNELEFVQRTESLYSVQYLRVVDDYVVRDPYLDVIPDEPGEIRALFDAASRNPFVIRNLLSEDRRSMSINVYLDDRERYPNFDREVAAAIEQAIRPLVEHVDEVFQIGLPYVRSTLAKTIVDDQKKLLPVSFAVLLITLVILVRSINSGIIPFFTSLTSIIWVLGFMGYIGIPVTLITSIVPILMIIIGSTEDVHLISEYLQARDTGENKHAAIRIMGGKKGFAILVTFITSYLGFISISANRIEMLQEFGIVASSGLFLNFIVTILLVPAWLSLFGSRKDRPSEIRTKDIFRPIINVFYHLVHRRKVETLLLTIAVMLVAGFGASKIQLNNNVMGYFHEDSPIKVRANTVTRSLAGMETFMIVMDSGIEDTFLKSRYLYEVAYLQSYIESTGLFDKTVSFADYMALLNSAVNDDSEIVLPEDDMIINEIQIFLNYRDVRQYISEDFSTAVIMVRHSLESSYELKRALQKLEKFVQENIDSGIDVRFTGESILTNRAADEMAVGQAKSLLIMLFIIFVVISLIFFNTKAGFLAIIPNLLPIIVLFGVMGYFNIPLDTGTAMIAAIAIGIVVDDTLHFMVRYNRNLKDTYDEESAIGSTMREEATPIISTSIALALGFSVLSQSSFVPVVYF